MQPLKAGYPTSAKALFQPPIIPSTEYSHNHILPVRGTLLALQTSKTMGSNLANPHSHSPLIVPIIVFILLRVVSFDHRHHIARSEV